MRPQAVNKAAEALLGYAEEELLNKDFSGIVADGSDAPKLKAVLTGEVSRCPCVEISIQARVPYTCARARIATPSARSGRPYLGLVQ